MKEITVSNEIDQITFATGENEGEIEILINDLYVSTIYKGASNERGWEELQNLGNPEPSHEQLSTVGEIQNSWMDS